MVIKTILLPTDFSETAAHAEAQAVALARRYRARLELFHVVEPYGEPPPNLLGAVRDYLAELEQAAEATLVRKAEALRADGVDVSFATSHYQSPFDGIVERIERSSPDLVVVGTHGRRGYQHLVLGSVAEKLLRTVRVNVLSLHLTAPVVGGEAGVTSILVPVDFSEPSSRALDLGFSLLAPGGAVHLVHVVHRPTHPSVYPLPLALGEPDVALTSAVQDHLDNWIGERTADSRILVGEPTQRILEAREETGAELIVMGTQGLTGLRHALLGSVTEKVVRGASVPVLTVH